MCGYAFLFMVIMFFFIWQTLEFLKYGDDARVNYFTINH